MEQSANGLEKLSRLTRLPVIASNLSSAVMSHGAAVPVNWSPIHAPHSSLPVRETFAVDFDEHAFARVAALPRQVFAWGPRAAFAGAAVPVANARQAASSDTQ